MLISLLGVGVVIGVGTYWTLVKRRREAPLDALVVWFVFGVALVLAPVVCDLGYVYFTGGSPSMASLLGKGQLFLVGVAIGANGVGKVIASGAGRKRFRVMAAGGSLLLVIMAALSYAFVARAQAVDAQRVADGSALLLFFSVLGAGSCVLISEAK